MNFKHCIIFVICCVRCVRCEVIPLQNPYNYTLTIDIISNNGKLIIKGTNQTINIKGVNWIGFNTLLHTAQGLWIQNMEYLLDFLQGHKFNAIRIPFAMDMIINTQIKPSYQSIDFTKNPHLAGLTSIQVMDYLIKRAAERCMLVLLDYHVFTGGDDISELWYNTVYTEKLVIAGWQSLATRYFNQWNVMGCDLNNEPHGIASWGDNNLATDWKLAAERIGNAILKVNPRLLIFVEGVQDRSFPPTNLPWGNSGNQWGGGLSSAGVNPVQLNIPEKLIYSPHIYGPDIGFENYFNDPTFPNNMPSIWDEQWGYLSRTNYTIVVGNFGGKEIEGTLSRVWTNKLLSWFTQKNITNCFFWCLNPNSMDSGGLLFNDWITPDLYKLAAMESLNPTPSNMCKFYPPPHKLQVIDKGPMSADSIDNVPKKYILDAPFIHIESWFRYSWTDNLNNIFSVYNATLSNINMPTMTEIIVTCVNCNIVQYWNSAYNDVTSIFSFPSSIRYSGGLRKNQTLNFGAITMNSPWNLSFATTYGSNG